MREMHDVIVGGLRVYGSACVWERVEESVWGRGRCGSGHVGQGWNKERSRVKGIPHTHMNTCIWTHKREGVRRRSHTHTHTHA
jgi:hypothetical protein